MCTVRSRYVVSRGLRTLNCLRLICVSGLTVYASVCLPACLSVCLSFSSLVSVSTTTSESLGLFQSFYLCICSFLSVHPHVCTYQSVMNSHFLSTGQFLRCYNSGQWSQEWLCCPLSISCALCPVHALWIQSFRVIAPTRKTLSSLIGFAVHCSNRNVAFDVFPADQNTN